MAPIWVVRVLENANASRTRRETRCRSVLWNRLLGLGVPGRRRNGRPSQRFPVAVKIEDAEAAII
jgi:hypothetical protein